MAKKNFMTLMKEKTVDVRPSVLSAEESIKSQIIILDSLRDLIPPPTEEEVRQLEQNLLLHGVKDPLTVWETTVTIAGTGDDDKPAYVLIDGHNRYRFIKKHQLDFRLNLVQFATLDEGREYMINYQLGRRNLTPDQASYLRGLRYIRQKTARGSNLTASAPQVNVSEVLAEEFGVSSRTIKRDGEFAAVLENLSPEIKRDVLAGKRKLTRSALYSLADSQTGPAPDPAGNLPTVSSELPVHSGSKRIITLQASIRKLSSGELDHQTCTRLIQKTNELLALLSPK